MVTPNKRIPKPVVRWTPSQTAVKTRLSSPPSSTKVTPKSLINTPVQIQSPTLIRTPISTQHTPNSEHKQTLVRNQLITKTAISPAQAVSKKLIQKSVKLLNAPKPKSSDKTPTDVFPSVKLFPPKVASDQTSTDSCNVPHLKAPLAPVPKLPPQQTLLPQEIHLILIQNWFQFKKEKWKLSLKLQN